MVSTRRSSRKVNEQVVNVKQSQNASSPKSSRRKPHAPRKFQIDATKGRLTRLIENRFTDNLGIRKLEQQTDEATFAAKHQLEDDQLSGSLPQATIRNSRIQALMMHLCTSQVTEKDASQEVNTMSNIAAPVENALMCATLGSNGLGEIRFSQTLGPFPSQVTEKDASQVENAVCASQTLDPFPDNTRTASRSLNLTEFADRIANDEFSDIDSLVGESSLICVRGYRVKPEYVAPLTSILAKHGDIGAQCSLDSVSVPSLYMEKLCDILQMLRGTSIGAITDNELEDMRASVSDIGKASVEVGWLKARLDEMFEAKKAIGQLQSSSTLKMLHAQRKKRLAEKKAELEEHKRQCANIEAQHRDILNQISADLSDISTIENQVLETDKAISESRAKLRKVFELSSLVDGLVET